MGYHGEVNVSATSFGQALRRPRILPRGWADFLVQLLLFALVDVVYEITRGLAEGSVEAAFDHARDIVSWERTLGMFNELDVQSFALHRHWVLDVANLTYFHAHFAVTTLFMFWAYLRRNRHYYFIRNAVFAADAIALAGYTFFPTAPPRMFPRLGFIDTLERYSSVNHNTFADLANPFAAVPSVHTCYSLLIASSCFFLVRQRFVRVAWLLYPCLIVFSIVATANHFWLDAVFGAAVAVVAVLVAWTIERRHPTLPPSARRRLRLEPARATG